MHILRFYFVRQNEWCATFKQYYKDIWEQLFTRVLVANKKIAPQKDGSWPSPMVRTIQLYTFILSQRAYLVKIHLVALMTVYYTDLSYSTSIHHFPATAFTIHKLCSILFYSNRLASSWLMNLSMNEVQNDCTSIPLVYHRLKSQ